MPVFIMTNQWLPDFLQFLRFEKRYSHHTLVAYQKDLLQFFVYTEDAFHLDDIAGINHFHIRSWLASLKDDNQSPRTINRKLSSLNSYYKYLMRLGRLKENPIRKLHSLKLPERLPSYLKETETEKMIEEIDYAEGFRGMTDRMICTILYKTGLRRSELLQLKEQDVEWSLSQIRVLGKGNKERLIPIDGDLLQAIRHYIDEKTKLPEHSVNLLVLENGKPLYAGYIYNIVKKYISSVSSLKKRSPHVLRHSFATHLLSNGANIQAIKDLLGHSSLAATQVYTHNNIEQLKEIHKTSHPRG